MARSNLLLAALTLASLTTAQVIYPGDSKWTYAGCYTETTTVNATNNLRALNGATETLETMTAPLCIEFCDGKGSSWAGLEYTKECYCGPGVNALSQKVEDTKCNLPCVGNSTQICGGSLLLSVYQKDANKNGGAGSVVGEVRVASLFALGIAFGGALVLM